MPDVEGRISEKGKLGLGFSAAAGKGAVRNGKPPAAAAELARRRRKSRPRERAGRMWLFGIGGTQFGNADPVIGERGMQIGRLDFGHVAAYTIFCGHRTSS